jgi:hypothetical protein
MGSIVKSIGKVIKKIGKGLKKVIKKIGPALLVAAAVYAGVAFYGASVTGVSGLGTANFSQGLASMGQKLMGFFSPTGTAQVAGQAGAAVTQAGAAQVAGAGLTGTELFAGYTGQAGVGAAASSSVIKSFSSAVAGGMTSGDALVYMTKMNMLATGVKMVAGFFDKSEEEQRQHEKELLSMKYAFGKPMTDEQKAFKAANPNWIGEHPAMQQQDLYSSPNLMQSQTMASLPTQATVPSPYVQQQTIGQPTLGRQSTRQYGTSAPTAFAGTTPGLIKQGTQGVFNPTKQRYA